MRIAVDTGGTFTDFVVLVEGQIHRFKIPSTPGNPAEAVAQGCARFAGFELLHGTTVATNAILEGKTARTGLLVNEGFRDLLQLGRQSRPELYAWEPRKPRLPVREEDVRTVAGGTSPSGEERESLQVPENWGLECCEALAICLLYAYANAEHEKRVAESLSQEFVSASHEVSPEAREYERACATVLNAAVSPLVARYLSELRGLSENVRIMSSLGGMISVEDATRLPIRTVVSGPAGGVAATVALGRRLRRQNLIAFDMGGTSTDVTLIENGVPAMTACADIAGLPVRLPRIDVHTVGCGGGSIAFVDGAGALRVGPESAGADPGPALFGGDRATVTDANFVLGRLPLTRFAKTDGINPVNCATVMGQLAAKLGLSPEEAAAAVVQVADQAMAAAVRKVSADRGYEPSEFYLVAFGGAGAMHACSVADQLEIKEILVPVGAGVFSAVGLLGASDLWEESLGVVGTDASWDETYAGLEERALGVLGNPDVLIRIASMRYIGQSHDLDVEVTGSREDAEGAFRVLHGKTFDTGFDTPVQWVSARVRVERHSIDDPVLALGSVPAEPENGIIEREALTRIVGPMVVIDDDSTIFVAPGWTAERLEDGTIRIFR